MPKNISWRKLVQKFRKLGFDGPYSGGRHLPNPHRRDISKHLIAEILRQANISVVEWENI